jgi:hypothetical protein
LERKIEKYTEKEIEVFTYLDALRKSGRTNMYGAGPYIEQQFGMEAAEAKNYLVKWMHTFPFRHPEETK